jgi:hypothetical protein
MPSRPRFPRVHWALNFLLRAFCSGLPRVLLECGLFEDGGILFWSLWIYLPLTKPPQATDAALLALILTARTHLDCSELCDRHELPVGREDS